MRHWIQGKQARSTWINHDQPVRSNFRVNIQPSPAGCARSNDGWELIVFFMFFFVEVGNKKRRVSKIELLFLFYCHNWFQKQEDLPNMFDFDFYWLNETARIQKYWLNTGWEHELSLLFMQFYSCFEYAANINISAKFRQTCSIPSSSSNGGVLETSFVNSFVLHWIYHVEIKH